MKKNVLIIVDAQIDFCVKNASLYVNGAEEAIKRLIAHLIRIDNEFYSNVIITKDWHIENHPSFADFGGMWPRHCVQNSFGSNLPYELIEALSMETYAPSIIVTKGEEEEAYGAFENINADLANIFRKADNIYVSGIAGDYCVKESVKQLIEKGYGKKIVMLTDAIASIDCEVFNKFLDDENLKHTTFEELEKH